MRVKDQLLEAQFELVTTATLPAPGKKGRVVYNIDTSSMLVDNGVSWSQSDSAPIGTVQASMLDEAEFQAEINNKWILADGRLVTGSDYEALTTENNVPDLRGQFLRGKNNGRVDGEENPGGDLALGDLQQGLVGPHSIPFESTGSQAFSGIISTPYGARVGNSNIGGDETRPRNMTVNYFIKINR